MGLRKNSKPHDSVKVDTLIGNRTAIEGNLVSQIDLRVEGAIKGKVECQGDVVIGKEGKVEANIIANNVTVAGEVVGNITARNKMEIIAGGKVLGDVETSSLIVADGTVFEGFCHMLPAQQEADEQEQPYLCLTESTK